MDAYGLTLRKHVHLNDRKKWLANYIRVGGGGKQTQITIPPLFCPPGTTTLFFSFAYEQKQMVLFTVKSETWDLT